MVLELIELKLIIEKLDHPKREEMLALVVKGIHYVAEIRDITEALLLEIDGLRRGTVK